MGDHVLSIRNHAYFVKFGLTLPHIISDKEHAEPHLIGISKELNTSESLQFIVVI